MSTPLTPVDPKATEAKPHPAENFAEELQLFWLKNRNAILLGCGIVLAGIIARGGWAFYQENKEARIAKAYAAAGSSDSLRKFAQDNDGHRLSGVAYLRLADEAYAAGRFADAQTAYAKAAEGMKDSALGARANLGAAMSLLGAGKTAEAKTALSLIANSATDFKSVRAEAAYHLANIAVEAGATEEAIRYMDQIMQVEPGSLWAQRAMLLRAGLPLSAPSSQNAESSAPEASGVKLTVPGK